MDKTKAIDYLGNLLQKRFKNKAELSQELSSYFNQNIVVEEKTRYEDEQDFDFNLLFDLELKDDLILVDIYYLLDNAKNLYITEIGYEIENELEQESLCNE